MSRQSKCHLLLMPPTRDFLVLPYYPGESVSGWFDGTTSLLSSSRIVLYSRIMGSEPDFADFSGVDLDVPSTFLLHALKRVESHRLGQSGAAGLHCLSLRLLPSARHAYCPICMANDAHQGRWPRFRNSWTWAYRTHCDIHLTPLYLWPLVKDGAIGEREFPSQWIDSFLSGNIAQRSIKVPHFDAQLKSARQDLRMLNSNSGFALAWRQQLRFEQDVGNLFKGSGNPGGLISGFGSRESLIRAIKDLVFLVSSNFFENCDFPYAASWCFEAGPPGMFMSPPRVLHYKRLDNVDPIRRISHPAIRRAVLNVVLRLLAGFQSDMRHSGSGKIFSELGANRVTDGLRDLPSEAKDWCRLRVAGWPQLLASGVIRSF